MKVTAVEDCCFPSRFSSSYTFSERWPLKMKRSFGCMEKERELKCIPNIHSVIEVKIDCVVIHDNVA